MPAPPTTTTTATPPAATSAEDAVRGRLRELARQAAEAGRQALTPAPPRALGRSRRPADDLDERDSYLLRDLMPVSWVASSLWFRAQVDGLHHVPESGPVLLVGNHSGGASSPDSVVLTTAFASRFGPERALYLLVHGAARAWPGRRVLRRLGVLPSCTETARAALAQGACVLVYPGGERELHRPSWDSASLDLGEDRSWVHLALEADAPIVPVVALGGQETALFLGPLDRLVERSGVGRLPLLRRVRVPSAPVALGPPWGVNVGGRLAQLPLPAKVTVQVLPAIDVRERFGPDPDPAVVAEHVTATMREMLDELARRRRLPVVG